MPNGTLSEEVARKRAAEALNGGDDDEQADDSLLDEQSQTEESQIGLGDEKPEDTLEVGGDTGTVREPKGKVQTFDDYSAASTSNLPSGGGAGVSTGTSANAPLNLDAEYVTEPSGKMIPRAQLVDPDPDVNYLQGEALRQQIASEQPQEPTGATQLPQVDVSAEAPPKLDQVERAQQVEAPAQLQQVERAQPVEAPAQVPQVERAQPAKGGVQTFDDYGAPPVQPSTAQPSTAQLSTAPFQPDTSGSKRLNAIYNNPGAMGLTKSALRFGATPSGHYDTGHAFAQFPTREAGAAAQFSMWQNPALYKGHTLAGAITNWIGPGEHGEAEFIAQKLGIPLNTVITDEFLRSSMGIRLMQAQAQYEGQNVLTPEQWKRGQDWAYGGIKPSGTAELPTGTDQSARKAAGIQTFDDYGAQPQQPQAPAMRMLSDQEAQDAQTRVQAAIQKQDSILTQLPEQTTSPVGLYNRLGSTIEGVSDARRLAYREQVKQEVTKAAQDYYGEKDPNKAFQRATADANFGTVTGEVLSKVGPYFNQAVTAFNQSAGVIDQNRLDALAKAVYPQASADARKTFINSIISDPDPGLRAAHINAVIGQLAQENPNNPALAALRATDIADSADRLANPEYQKRQKEEIDRQVAQNMRDLRPDPGLQGTPAQWWTEQLAQLPKNIVEGVTGPLGDSLMVSEIYQGTMERLRQENPGMSEDELKAKIGGSSATQVIAMMVLNRLSGGKLGTMVGQIENPATRIGASALMHIGTGGSIGAAQQVATNIAEGKSAFEGVPQAAGAGAVQALPGALISGMHGPEPRTEEPVSPVTERPPVTEQPPVAERPPAPVVEPTQPVTREDVARRAYEISQEREQTGRPGDALGDWDQAQRELATAKEPVTPVAQGDDEPIVSAIANRYTAERMARGELGQIDPSQGTSTEDLVAQGLKMSPQQREDLINNFVQGKGGDLDQQGAAIRAKEAFLSEQSRAASRVAQAEPTNPQLQSAAKAANDEVTAFHNGPLKQFKRVWSDSGRVLQQELPLDFTTLNGMKEAYLKQQNKAAPDSLEPALQKVANGVSKAADAERIAMNNFGNAIENEVQKQTRTGRKLPTDDQVRARLAEIMKDFPCPT